MQRPPQRQFVKGPLSAPRISDATTPSRGTNGTRFGCNSSASTGTVTAQKNTASRHHDLWQLRQYKHQRNYLLALTNGHTARVPRKSDWDHKHHGRHDGAWRHMQDHASLQHARPRRLSRHRFQYRHEQYLLGPLLWHRHCTIQRRAIASTQVGKNLEVSLLVSSGFASITQGGIITA